MSGLLGVKVEQDVVIREYLYERKAMMVDPYGYTVEEFTKSISDLKNWLANCGIKDEGIKVPIQNCGIKVPIQLEAENKTMSNLLYANFDCLSYGRTPKEMLRILYTTGNATIPGGFFPLRANGVIAKSV